MSDLISTYMLQIKIVPGYFSILLCTYIINIDSDSNIFTYAWVKYK